MSYLALYRKYRPTNFSDVVGQDKVIKVIKNAVLNNKISHAYLFSGPRGTGKTTTAKIIAKMVNCQNLKDGNPCNECSSCVNINNSSDIVEIDAASNNGVDEIRELRDKVNLVPTECKYKIYIIDEVHMLTVQAFNALLKTLEEPPSHVIFILATTEPYKIPLTVASRCQKFQFSKISDSEIVRRLKSICEQESLTVDEDILYEIARMSDGGLRDAINLLDQLVTYKSENITLEDVYKISGTVSYFEMYDLILNIVNKNNKNIIDFVENLDKSGKNISKFIEELIIFLKDILIFMNSSRLTNIEDKNEKIKDISTKINQKFLYSFINKLNDLLVKLKTASYPSILLLVCFLECNNESNAQEEKVEIKEEVKKKKNEEVKIQPILEEKTIASKSEEIKEESDNLISQELVNIRINNALTTASKIKLNEMKETWKKISDYLLEDRFAVVVGLLSDVIPVVVGEDNIILESRYDSIATRLNGMLDNIHDLLLAMTNHEYKVIVISVDRWNKEKIEYVNKIKNNYKYSLIPEEEKIDEKKEDTELTAVDKLLNLFGNDIIEYK